MMDLPIAWVRVPSAEQPVQALPTDLPPCGQVDVLSVELPDTDDALTDLYKLLTDEERMQADRYRVAAPRRRFVLGRGLMRQALGSCLGCSPEHVALTIPASGKPALDPRAGDADLQFNLSHSGDRVVLAIAVGTPVGVDVEELAERRMQREIAEKHYHPNELALLDAATGDDKATVFCRCWTLKEAVIKAIGEGLRYPIRTLDFSGVLSGATTDVVADGQTWRCLELDQGPGYCCAVAWALPNA